MKPEIDLFGVGRCSWNCPELHKTPSGGRFCSIMPGASYSDGVNPSVCWLWARDLVAIMVKLEISERPVCEPEQPK